MTRRFLIFKARERQTWLCVVAARDKRHVIALEETWLERGMA